MILRVAGSDDPCRGTLTAAGRTMPCALGRSGLAAEKREGDGATPIGRFALRRVFYRPDRTAPPSTALATQAITPTMGWSDDPDDPVHYNRLVTLPYSGSHEVMARADRLYDLLVEIGFNDRPPVAGAGSAIFLHVAGPGLAATAGCIAVPIEPLIEIVALLSPGDMVEITAPALPGRRK